VFQRLLSFWKPRKSALEAREDLFLAALDRLTEHQTRQVESMCSALVGVTEVLKTQMAAYQTSGTPESWPLDDILAIEAEKARRATSGLPEGLSPVDELRWVLDQSGR
jgi:hypothetical protein